MKTFYTKNNINYILETTGSYHPYLNRYENDKLVFSCFFKTR